MEWQPIETAPKDGTIVLLYCPDGADRPNWVWDDRKMTVCMGYRGNVHPDFGPFDGWVSSEMDVGIVEYGELTGASLERENIPLSPTHWMPLPQPPAGD